MANITFLIGNGFDLQIGMNTRYTNFYDVYINDDAGDIESVTKFKAKILEDKRNKWENWSDFELGMGKASADFDSPVDFIDCFDNFVVKFHGYLQKECQSIDWEKVSGEVHTEFFNSITQFWRRINSVERERFAKAVIHQTKGNLNFLQLNYTDTFDKLLPHFQTMLNKALNATNSRFVETYGIRKVENNLHIHGSLGNRPVIGVDNAAQIENVKIRQDSSVASVFVKRESLAAIQKRDVNTAIDANKALEIIQSSSIICSYGASIGDTDTYWWKIIGDWLKESGNSFVIFDICGKDDDRISPRSFLKRENDLINRRVEIFNRFVRLAGWTEDDTKQNESKIVIELDCKIFDFKLPRKVASDAMEEKE